MLRRRAVQIGLATLCTGIGASSYVVSNDEGARRSLQFWKGVFPIYLHYRSVQLLSRDLGILEKERADQEFDKLHEMYTDKICSIVYTMRGFYLKQAQLMSCQDDFVPPAYMRWVKDTQDRVPSDFPGTMAREYVRKVLAEEQGMDFDEVFSKWDDTPLGVASIGQVHKAVLRKTGEVVAVKFLVPGIETKFRSDIRTLKAFCQLAMPQHVSAFDEIEKQFCTEFDYVAEGENLQTIYEAIMPKWSHAVAIPRPKMEYCSKTVLVMEYLDGIKLVDGVREQYKQLVESENRSFEEMVAEQRQQIMNGTFKFKSVEESKAERHQLGWYLFAKDAAQPVNIARFLWNWTAGWVAAPIPYARTPLPIDLGHMLEVIAQVHGDQIFEHGVFNGDCHPGNILLLSDGRLGLIDYGQVKRMTLKERLTYAKLMVAHASDDRDEVVRIHFNEMGTVTKHMNREIAYLMNTFYHDRDTQDILQGHNIATFVDWLEAEDPMVRLAAEYLFAARVSIMVRGMAKAFGMQLKMSSMWEKQAREFLHKHGVTHNPTHRNLHHLSSELHMATNLALA